MFLARALNMFRCEMVADFQQYYGLNLLAFELDTDEYTVDVERASILAAQLPPEGRVKRAISPLNAVTQTENLLRNLEYDVRIFMYSMASKESRGEEPEPYWFDGELEAAERRRKAEAMRSASIADKFNLNGLEAAYG